MTKAAPALYLAGLVAAGLFVSVARTPPAVAPKPEIVKQQPKSSVPLPRPKPKQKPVEKQQKKKVAKAKSKLPSCAAVKRAYDAMTHAERIARYLRSTPEEVAHGRRCLGL